MIKLDTTFVVGAGASVDYSFPLGQQLTTDIAAALNTDGSGGSPARSLIRAGITHACRDPDMQRDPSQMLRKARALRTALSTASSIDTFLENHSDDSAFELIGKIAIAACLITAERRSELQQRHPGDLINLARVENSWLARLFKTVLAPGIPKASVERIFDHVSFVVFNYDRCIEHYFAHALASHFILDLPTAAGIVREHLRIVHPYGDLGALTGNTTVAKVDFGQEYHPDTFEGGDGIYAMSRRLLTFTESKRALGVEAKAMIKKANRLVFLGFGFGEQNVELLTAQPTQIKQVRATVMGLSDSNVNEVRYRITQMTGKAFEIGNFLDCNCTKLISDEQMFLTRSS